MALTSATLGGSHLADKERRALESAPQIGLLGLPGFQQVLTQAATSLVAQRTPDLLSANVLYVTSCPPEIVPPSYILSALGLHHSGMSFSDRDKDKEV